MGRSRLSRSNARRVAVRARRHERSWLRRAQAIRVRQHIEIYRKYLGARAAGNDGHARREHHRLLRLHATAASIPTDRLLVFARLLRAPEAVVLTRR